MVSNNYPNSKAYSLGKLNKLNLDYSTAFSLAPFINENVITIIGICLLIGAMAKSSQLGLHVWLPMAMEGLFKLFLLLIIGFFCTPGLINFIYFNTSRNNIPYRVSTINRKKCIISIHTSSKRLLYECMI